MCHSLHLQTQTLRLIEISHGLSYTTFVLSSITLQKYHPSSSPPSHPAPLPPTFVDVTVQNTGPVAGAIVLQLYILTSESKTRRPIKELHGFEKVFLEPGEERKVSMEIDRYACSFWDEAEEKWCVEKGKYRIVVATSGGEGGQSAECDLVIHETWWWSGLE
jgi:beta-glucosidase